MIAKGIIIAGTQSSSGKTAVVALLLWFYISALITLLGAQLNGELDRLRAARGK